MITFTRPEFGLFLVVALAVMLAGALGAGWAGYMLGYRDRGEHRPDWTDSELTQLATPLEPVQVQRTLPPELDSFVRQGAPKRQMMSDRPGGHLTPAALAAAMDQAHGPSTTPISAIIGPGGQAGIGNLAAAARRYEPRHRAPSRVTAEIARMRAETDTFIAGMKGGR